MKIGILTHPLRTNYGGILQNYALQTILKRMGHDVLTIDRHNDKSRFYLITSYIKRNIEYYIFGKKQILTSYYINLTRKQFLYVSKNIQKFIKEHIQTTNYIKSAAGLKRSVSYGFDCYVVGSDQVWLNSYAPSTFLDFLGDLSTKRVAYAASFGRSDWTYNEKKTERCRVLAQKFDEISVREKSAVSLCRQYLDVGVTPVLDPTMLLCKEDYISLIDKTQQKQRKNVMMTYILDPTQEKMDLVSRISGKLGLSSFEVKPKCSNYTTSISIEDMVVPDVEEWIAGFRDADFVVTDSFHGTVFAIIFNKQFIVIGNNKRGLDRFTSLLLLMKIENRLIDIDSIFDEVSILQELIDYNVVNNILLEERGKSLQFLINAIDK